MDDFYADTEFFSFQRDFVAALPPTTLVDEVKLVDDIERYLDGVSQIVFDLERVFNE
jgi:hypothetical protein